MISTLERVLEELPGHKHPSPFPTPLNPFLASEWSDIATCAIGMLSDEEEIREFFGQYVTYIHEKHGLKITEAEKSAKSILGYSTGYVNDEQANKWFDALPDISHPVIGRERPFKLADNVAGYYIIANTDDPEIKDYLIEEIPRLFDSLRNMFSVIYMEKPADDPYVIFSLRRTKEKDMLFQTKKDNYMFLSGFVMGIEFAMERDLGKKCDIYLDLLRNVN